MAIKIVNPQVVSFSPVSTAEVGQTIKVKQVNENNKPIEWEATDFPEGVKSWNELEDRPFYDESYTGEITYEFDGDLNGKEVVTFNSTPIVKMSDFAPTLAELEAATGFYYDPTDGTSKPLTSEVLEILNLSEEEAFGIEGYILMLRYPLLNESGDTDTMGIVMSLPFGFPAYGIPAGLWFFYSENDYYCQSLTYTGTVEHIKKLDPKYLPEGGVGYDKIIDLGSTIAWDGTPSDTIVDFMGLELHHVSDSTPNVDELVGGSFTMRLVFNSANGESDENSNDEFELTSDKVVQISANIIALFHSSSACIGIVREDGATYDTGSGIVTFPKKGVYFVYTEFDSFDGNAGEGLYNVSSLTKEGYNFTKTEVHKIDPKYLPEGIGYEETYTGEITIEWDGDPTGKPTVDAGGGVLIVKISDNTPTMSEVLSGQVVIDGGSTAITEDMIVDASAEGVPALIVAEGIFICYEVVSELGISEAGTYVISEMPSFAFIYTGTATNIHKIDPKYLEFSKKSEIANETVDASRDCVGFANDFNLDAGETYIVDFDGTQYTCVARLLEGVVFMGNLYIAGASEDSGEPFIIAKQDDGCWMTVRSYGVYHIKICHVVEYAKIPKECLPDDLSGLPKVTSDDNGKVLTVDNGQWKAFNLPEIPEIIVDAEISDTSTNAVQNKVIKEYIDTSIASAINAAIAATY